MSTASQHTLIHPTESANSLNLTLVTAFFDIGRDQWNHYPRSVDEYTSAFAEYQKLPYPIVLFMDDRYLQKVAVRSGLTIIPINHAWLEENCWAWQQLTRESEIMATALHKSRVQHRIACPETHNPRYTLINHAKIDFVCYAITHGLLTSSHIAWSDFGFFSCGKNVPGVHMPSRPLELERFDTAKVNYGLLNPIDERDRDPLYTLRYAPERISGGFFLATPTIMLQYQSIYHSKLTDWQTQGFADDDQHLVLRCYLDHPDLVNPLFIGKWCVQYVFFQKA
jgi:hypothetical protein